LFALATERLLLRDLQAEDEPAMALLRLDPLVTRYIDYIASDTAEEVRAWLFATMEQNARLPRESWNLAIVRRADGAVLGWIGIGQSSQPERGELDFGYALLPRYQGQGYAAEALRSLMAWCFEHLGIQRIYGECDARNLASARVMEKAGLLPDPCPGPDGGDELRFALDRTTWAGRASPPPPGRRSAT